MKATITFLLHLLLLPALLLLAPGGFLTTARSTQCRPTFSTDEDKYTTVLTVPETESDQRNGTLYVRKQQNLRVKLEVNGKSVEFVLKEDCFQGDGQWQSLLTRVQRSGSLVKNDKDIPACIFEVRTSTCIRLCYEKINITLGSLEVSAKGKSEWRQKIMEGACGDIPHWTTEKYQETSQWCSDIRSSSPSITTPAKRTTTQTKPSITPDSSKKPKNPSKTSNNPSKPPNKPTINSIEPTTTTTKPTRTTTEPTTTTTEPTTTPTEPTTTPTEPTTTQTEPPTNASLTDGQIGGVIVGVIAVIVVVAVLVMIVVKKRRSQPPAKEVAMRPQNTESPREGNVNSLYESADRLEPVRDTGDRQGPASSLQETVDRQGSVNSLYEPFEKFRAAQ